MPEQNFAALGLAPALAARLADIGFETPTPIQQLAIPVALERRDILGIAKTGTGKTAAFALPLLQRLHGQNAKASQPRALILAPTRELAAQIGDELKAFGGKHARHAVIFGGVGQAPQVKALRGGIDVLVATPGRLLDLMQQRLVRLDAVQVLVLDEADRLLDMGFVRDVRKIVAATPQSRQTLLFSATMPKAVAELAADILTDPERIDVTPKEVAVSRIDQQVVMVGNDKKRMVLQQLLRAPEVSRAIVFTRTKHGANRLSKQLGNAGIEAEAIHGNKSQSQRQKALASFKSGKSWVLVATDIAARGIDIDGISHVFNFELPHEPESYVHRIGRTARAGASGSACSLVDPSEEPRLRAIERLIRFTPPAHSAALEGGEVHLTPIERKPQADRPKSQAGRVRKSGQSKQRQGGGSAPNRATAPTDGASRRRRRPRRRKPAAGAAIA